ncbi:MAG TPA: sigma-70 family RNA polymerase sigma factor [Candidatus Coatesbacteria bacterium]|nr:sigma-70 family RNA polymerase sigma factor [Candidatus Coatesbacteria bacterium]
MVDYDPGTGGVRRGTGSAAAEGEDVERALTVSASERAAFERFVEEHAPEVYNIAMVLTGDRHRADELAQEAFLKLYRSLRHFDPDRSLRNWLYTVLKNLYIDSWRRENRMRTTSIDEPIPLGGGSSVPFQLESPEPDPEAAVASREVARVVRSAVSRLPKKYAMAVALCDLEGLTYEEISEVMECSIGTVRSRIHRGRKLLRERLAHLAPQLLGGPPT